MRKGLFITIEGPDGSGKSTQIEFISAFLKANGYETVQTREPGGTEIGEKIRSVILDKNNTDMDSVTEMLLYAASRAQHVAQLIKPAISEGKAVICDRFVDSSLAYQGYGRGLGNCVSVINEYAVMGCMPDVTFLLKLSPEIGRSRIKDEDADRLELETMNFHNEVYRGYLEIEKAYPERVVGIDAAGSIEEISGVIEKKLKEILTKYGE